MPNRPMHISTELWEKLKPLARQKHKEPTAGKKFRRQYVIDRFIVDFYCAELQLAIEVDGEIHNYTQQEDAIRQTVIEAYNVKVIRFSNDDILKEIDSTLEKIYYILTSFPHKDAPSPSIGEGVGGEEPILGSSSGISRFASNS